ncbi:metal-dependent hydrolase [Pseudothauera nasutitermitis]|uniref:Metal-dependent hydrolase n=1 Tax=Pseudothauera nasutitermitis TaxID=2565930 RepID=A0A4S4AXH6_9RHOO|nr:metal-dependent hydrolase [Pseudothauera nasutitermitis]THF64620.1 metal-dependent hydrolase [Pseudothauera nasutitermitis]
MDTLTHALSGALLGRVMARPAGAPADDRRPAALAAVLAGAAAGAFPDIDFVLGYISEITYLRGHRGVTHSLLLAPLWALPLAWLMARLAAWSTAGRPSWRGFYPVALGGVLIHIAGDFITQFGTMMLAPFSDWRFGLGTTFIIDLVFTGILIAGLLASAVWRRSRLPAVLAFAALAGWVGLSWQGRSEAIDAGRAYAAAHGIAIEHIDAAPRPASPFNWTVVLFDGSAYHLTHLNTRRTEALTVTPDASFIRRFSAPYLPVAQAGWIRLPMFGGAGDKAFARAVWQADEFAFFRWFSMFPVLDQVADGPQGQRCAAFRDLRFDIPQRDHRPFRYGLCAPSADGPWRLYALSGDGARWLDDDSRAPLTSAARP